MTKKNFFDEISRICKRYECSDFYLGRSIPASKLTNARMNYHIPIDLTVLALIDATVMGSANNGLAICEDGIYWNNGALNTSSRQYIPWEDFPDINISEKDSYEVSFGPSTYFSTAGSSMKVPYVVGVLREIQNYLVELFEENDDDDDITETAETSNC